MNREDSKITTTIAPNTSVVVPSCSVVEPSLFLSAVPCFSCFDNFSPGFLNGKAVRLAEVEDAVVVDDTSFFGEACLSNEAGTIERGAEWEGMATDRVVGNGGCCLPVFKLSELASCLADSVSQIDFALENGPETTCALHGSVRLKAINQKKMKTGRILASSPNNASSDSIPPDIDHFC